MAAVSQLSSAMRRHSVRDAAAIQPRCFGASRPFSTSSPPGGDNPKPTMRRKFSSDASVAAISINGLGAANGLASGGANGGVNRPTIPLDQSSLLMKRESSQAAAEGASANQQQLTAEEKYQKNFDQQQQDQQPLEQYFAKYVGLSGGEIIYQKLMENDVRMVTGYSGGANLVGACSWIMST